MRDITEFVTNVDNIPIEHLAILLGLAAVALAAFAIHAVLKLINRKGDS